MNYIKIYTTSLIFKKNNSTRYYKEYLIYLFIIVSLFLLSGCKQNNQLKDRPKALNGSINLQNWDFEKQGSVKLDGEWLFIKEQLIDDFPGFKDNENFKPLRVKIPSIWNSYNDKKAFGCGTYSLLIHLDDPDHIYSIRTREIFSSYKLIVDGKVLIKSGKVATDKKNYVPNYGSFLTSFKPKSNMVVLVIQVSNFHHKWGGIRDSLELGTNRQMQSKRDVSFFWHYLLFGCVLIMALYHLGLFALSKHDSSPLWFAVLCIIMTSRILVTEDMFILNIFPGLSFAAHLRIIVIGYQLALPVFLTYLYSLFGEEFNKTIIRLVQIITFIFSIYVFVTPPIIFTRTEIIFEILIIISFIYVIFSVTRAAIKRREGAIVVLAGLIVLWISVLYDIMQAQLVLKSPVFHTVVPIGFFIFIFSQSFILSVRFSKAYKMASIDYLSQIFNRRRFMELARDRFYNLDSPLGIILIDADYFKNINDTYGHDAGDAVLKSLVNTIKKGIRETDIFGRIGGEEFALLLSGLDDDQLFKTGNRLRKAVKNTVINMNDINLQITISMGISMKLAKEDSLEKMIKRADKALYMAKTNGRNRVVMSENWE